jgi:pimeloyl-ACP methyl ester carboxylesterase
MAKTQWVGHRVPCLGEHPDMKVRHWTLAAAGFLLFLFSCWQIGRASNGLAITLVYSTDPVLHILSPNEVPPGDRPLVLVGHGFAGSTVIMRGFAFTLAHAGYTVVLWDFDGHGTNPRPMPADTRSDALLANAEAALAALLDFGYGDPGRVAILGHSMGSGVALAFGQKHPGTAATIAVSPVGTAVTPELPRNLLLMAGSLEAPFLRNAGERLAEAGGPGGDPAAGTARKLVVVPGVEHISILFSHTAHAAARDWLDATFGPQPGARDYTDRRVLWYGLGVLGALLAGAGLAPLVADSGGEGGQMRPLWWRLGALAGGALGATLALWLASLAGLGLRALLGMNVGGYLLIWFGLAGAFSLLLLWVRPSLPSRRALLGGLMAFAVLWLGVGLLGQLVWLPWLLIPRRLVLWLPGAVLLLPWFLAAGETVRGTRAIGRIGGWLAHSLLVSGILFLAMRLSPDLGFLILILPLFPVVLGLHALAAAPQRGSWAFALSGALFVSWLLLAVFPLQ